MLQKYSRAILKSETLTLAEIFQSCLFYKYLYIAPKWITERKSNYIISILGELANLNNSNNIKKVNAALFIMALFP